MDEIDPVDAFLKSKAPAPAAAPAQPKSAPSKLESGVRGFAQGATFGFGDEIDAGLFSARDTTIKKVRSFFTGEQTPTYADSYRGLRDEFRAQERAAREANPATYLAGEVGGALAVTAVPVLGAAGKVGQAAGAVGRVGRAAQAGAVYGGLTGAGRSESEDVGGVVVDAATGAALGVAVGGALSGAANGVRGLVRLAPEVAAKGPTRAVYDALNLPPLARYAADGVAAVATGGQSLVPRVVGTVLNKSGLGKSAVVQGAAQKIAGTVEGPGVTRVVDQGQLSRAANIGASALQQAPESDDPVDVFLKSKAPGSAAEAPVQDTGEIDPVDAFLKKPIKVGGVPAKYAHPALPAASAPLIATVARLETQGGKKNVGQNNEFNVKDFSKGGTGTRGYDRAEGSNDRYRNYESPDEGVNDFVSLIERKYPKAFAALQAGDAVRFAQELKNGGYATDPKYVAKLVATYNSVTRTA